MVWVRLISLLAGCLMLLGVAGCANLPFFAASRLRADVHEGDTVTFHEDGDEITMDITSKKGIGSVSIDRLGPPPKKVTFNFHLRGLEEMKLGWSGGHQSVYVSSGDSSVRGAMGIGTEYEVPVDDTSEYWMPVEIKPAGGTIPLEDGYFSVTAPQIFIEAAPDSFAVSWIDFYR
jgi:hypothetical protein